MRPDVILFDEPTSALDPELVGEVLNTIRQLAQEKRTMVIVTHEMSFARDVADRAIFMDQGRIVEQGEAKALFASPQQPRTRQFRKIPDAVKHGLARRLSFAGAAAFSPLSRRVTPRDTSLRY